jgi:hypothetical protein
MICSTYFFKQIIIIENSATSINVIFLVCGELIHGSMRMKFSFLKILVRISIKFRRPILRRGHTKNLSAEFNFGFCLPNVPHKLHIFSNDGNTIEEINKITPTHLSY